MEIKLEVSAANSQKPMIEAKDLCITINQSNILKSLNFQVAAGEIYALLGGNGAGKSTTLKTFLGFLQPSTGQAIINGRAVKDDVKAVRQHTAYLPESATLYQHLTARENVHYFLSLANINKTDDQVNQAFDRVALQPQARDRHMNTYSKGMRQKTAIALALLREAPIFFLDEPTSGLDPVAIDEFNQLVSELAANGSTILMVTHDVYGACQVANRIGLLREGELVGEFSAQAGQQIETELVHGAFTQKGTA